MALDMFHPTEAELKNRLRFDNPWWESAKDLDILLSGMRERTYLDPFYKLATQRDVNRAVVMMGPRRVGKTVILRQTVKRLLESGVDPARILFASLENPIYTGLPLAKILSFFQDMHGHNRFADVYVIFDEIQYLKHWEVHLKTLVDDFPNYRFVVSGSAAAALKMKSAESGAGRFTDFLLPPLSFAEFLSFREVPTDSDIDRLNEELFAYINFGGFPEAVTKQAIREDFQRFVGSDILDKVLLRDIPSLYGIGDPQDLNRFFASLAYNTGNEISIDEFSKSSGVAKNTIRKYLDYLESAFLIHRLYRIDKSGKRFQRETHFKVYLTNPCLRSALFGPIGPDDDKAGLLVETAIVAQWALSDTVERVNYASWPKGEVDLVETLPSGRRSPIEIKWRNKIEVCDLSALRQFMKTHGLTQGSILTRTLDREWSIDGLVIDCMPVASWCWGIGLMIEHGLEKGERPRRLLPDMMSAPKAP